eukprot:scaffold923_cov256-Pinguiococcus_pyrenoidosus.AAC.44
MLAVHERRGGSSGIQGLDDRVKVWLEEEGDADPAPIPLLRCHVSVGMGAEHPMRSASISRDPMRQHVSDVHEEPAFPRRHEHPLLRLPLSDLQTLIQARGGVSCDERQASIVGVLPTSLVAGVPQRLPQRISQRPQHPETAIIVLLEVSAKNTKCEAASRATLFPQRNPSAGEPFRQIQAQSHTSHDIRSKR